ncbi:hypothetical protein B0T13DRAFT_314614 [Neurospora crassa]|nr:hypothetical protein B0T13DRAFT_314614 [Neurospora crassa]
MYTLHHDMNMDIGSWSARFLSTPLMFQTKSVGDSLMGVAFAEALASGSSTSTSGKDVGSSEESGKWWRTWRNVLDLMDLMPLDMKMGLDFKLEVEAMPVESAVLRLEDWVYNVAGL